MQKTVSFVVFPVVVFTLVHSSCRITVNHGVTQKCNGEQEVKRINAKFLHSPLGFFSPVSDFAGLVPLVVS
jgi:hypothetical protein